MEITLDKIDMIRDRMGVSIAQARDALVAADGDVVEALVNLEKGAEAKGGDTGPSWMDKRATEVTDKVKELWAKGSDTKIRLVNKEDQTLFDVPLTAGVVGAILAPQAALAGALVAYASKCSFEIKSTDNTSQKQDGAGDTTGEENGAAGDSQPMQ